MPGVWASFYSFSPAEMITLALIAVLVAVVSALGVRTWKLSRLSPEEFEKKRRGSLAAKGKMGDATLVEIHDNLLYYSYDVRGVEYTASQDVSTLEAHMPQDFSFAIGPVYVKYDARNPANSIVLAEEWSGLRVNSHQAY
jgi:hypothetical protein